MKNNAPDQPAASVGVRVQRLVRPVTVRLSEDDWNALVNFVGGDLGNMSHGDPVAEQMHRISDEIRRAVVKHSA